MAVVDQLTSNMTELLNLSGDCGRDLTDQDLQTIEYFRSDLALVVLCSTSN